MNIKIWSNAFYILTLLLSGFYNLQVEAFFIILSMTASVFYHFFREKNHQLFIIDSVCSLLLIGSNLYLSYLSNFKWPYFYLAVLFVVVAFYFYFRAQRSNYQFYHSIWHIACALITTFSIMSIIIN